MTRGELMLLFLTLRSDAMGRPFPARYTPQTGKDFDKFLVWCGENTVHPPSYMRWCFEEAARTGRKPPYLTQLRTRALLAAWQGPV